MPRRYRVPMPPVAVSAAQDMWQIKGATGKMVRVLRVKIGETDTTPATGQMLSVRARFLPATVTDGTGGTSATIAKTDPGDAAASFTALLNNTGKATTNGTAVIDIEDGFYNLGGWDHFWLTPPVIGPSESFVIEMLSTPSGTVTLAGYVEVEEIGG